MNEMEHLRHYKAEICSHHCIDHEIAESLTRDDTPEAAIARMDRYQVAIAVALTGCSCGKTDTECERLLDNQHQHGRKDGCAIAALGVEHRHLVDCQRTGGDKFLTRGVLARETDLDSSTHLLTDSHSRLIDGLIGEHQRHVAIDADGALLHTVDVCGEILGDEVYALHHLTAHQALRIVEIGSVACHTHIGRGITHTDELTGELGAGLVDNDYRHLVDRLVVVHP